ncbi:MAG: phosphoglycolate phosphatase [Alphaproteobacteria bacterium]
MNEERARKIRERFDAVVFDLDGTLVDTASDIVTHLNEMLIDLGRPGLALDEVRPMIGDGVRALLIRGLETSGGVPDGLDIEALFHRYLARYAERPVRTGGPYPGMVDTLEALAGAGVRLGVCTNKPQAPTDRLLRMLDLDRHFAAVIGGDALPVKKPDPAHLLAVLEQLDVRPERAALIGDSDTDRKTARRAGIPCILVSYGYTAIPAADLGADVVIDQAADLTSALASL